MRESLHRALTWALALALLAAIAGTVYLAVTPQETTDPYTEFYILGPGGNASGYPTNLTVGETGTVIVGITNHEHEVTTYTLVLALANETVERRTVEVADEATWEERVSFVPTEPGRQRLRFLLYKGTDPDLVDEPYRHLRLWLEVREP